VHARARSNEGWQNPFAEQRLTEGIVLLPDQVLEVRWQGGQVHLMRRAKRPDELETDPEGWKEAGYV
jgi:hypothetical protein